MLEPPTVEQTLEIIKKIRALYEVFHDVKFTESALETVVKLSERYISDKQFPDKAIDVFDETAAICGLNKKSQIDDIDVQGVVARITGIPVTSLGKSERERLKLMETDLNRVVIGQEEAIKALAQAVKRTRTGVRSHKRPPSFLFLGPTGVGKTETAKQLAKYLFDKEDAMIRIDMSEYSEKFTVSSLVGAPPGYVGYEQGGKLTEAVRRHPYSVVLFDEIEKAHPDVFNILLQIFDDGYITDAAGRKIDFRNTIPIITSNVGSVSAGHGSLGFGNLSREEEVKQNLTTALKGHFKPEFLNRISAIVSYRNLSKDHIKSILGLMVKEMNQTFEITFTEAANDYFTKEGYSPEYGARPLRRLLENEIEARLADLLLDTPEATKFTVDIVEGQIRAAIK